MIQLPDNFKLIAEFTTGSHMYGTSTPESDVDTRGVFIPSKGYFYGFLNRTEQYEDKKEDTVYHEIRKFLFLALQNNPTIIEYLFIPFQNVTMKTREWERIVNNRDLFLSTKCKFTFSGYAHSQLKRIKGHRAWLLNPPKKKPEREDFNLPKERSLVSHDQIGAFNVIIANYLEQIAHNHKLREQLEEMQETHNYKAIVQNTVEMDYNAVQAIAPLSDNMIEAIAKEKAYTNAVRHWKQYQNWKKTRHPERAKLEERFGYDTKHAMHLYRLIEECRELMQTGFITLPRPDRGHLLAIKNGLYTFDTLLERFQNLDAELDELYNNSILPKKPNSKEIDQLCVDIIENHFGTEATKKTITGIMDPLTGAILSMDKGDE